MKEDFFAEGFDDNPGIKFTQQQQQFFKSKLPLLDREKKNYVQVGQALDILKYTGLSHETVKKILNNLKLTNKGSLDYTQMKKIFRGVALAQNKIQPSSINIQANIKTPLPKFYDEDSQQQQPKQQKKPQPKKQVQKNPPIAQKASKPASFDDFGAFNQAFDQKPNQNTSIQQNIPVQKQSHKVISKSSGDQHHKVQNALSKNIKKFEDYWSKLPTIDGIKIKGDEVKRLFGNSQNKKQLYKLWKLCSQSYKDCLSKGQLYIFISLMNSKSSLIPSKLSPEMLFAIQRLDGANKNKQKTRQNDHNLRVSNSSGIAFDGFDVQKSHQFDKSQATKVQKKPSNNRLSGNHQFDDFANFANPNPTPKFQNIQQKQIRSPETKQFTPSKKFQIPPPPPIQIRGPEQINYLPKQVIELMYQASARQYVALVNQFIPPLQQLSLQNKQYKVQLQNINVNLNNTDQALINTYNKLNEVKTSQDELNNRLTSTCIRMQKIIQKQSQLINYLMDMMQSQQSINNQKVAALTLDAQNMEEQVNQKVKSVQNMVQSRSKMQYQPRNSIQKIPQNYNQYQQQTNMTTSTHYNKKSAELFQSRQSLRKKQQQYPPQVHNQEKPKNKTQQDQMNVSVPPNMYHQKLRQQLLQQQRLHMNDPNYKMEQSQLQVNQSKKGNDGYHWDIGNGHQFIVNQQNFKKTDSQSQGQQQKMKAQKIKQDQLAKKQLEIQQQQYQLQQQKKYLAYQAQLQAQQQAQMQAQLQAQQQSQLQQAQIQAQMQAQQQLAKQNQAQLQAQLQAQQAQQPLDQYGQRIRMKQAQLLLLINYTNPISQEQHLKVVEMIKKMDELQLDTTYSKIYNVYLQKVQANKQNGTNPVIANMPTEEQFKTNKMPKINQ